MGLRFETRGSDSPWVGMVGQQKSRGTAWWSDAGSSWGAVRAAAAGEPVLSPSVAGRLMGQVRRPVKAALTDREPQVLALVADGASNRQAAAKLLALE